MPSSPTRSIRTSTQQTACDVCGRTLLRGERAEIYLSGGDRHSVCELCTSRALHGGWVREGTVTDLGDGGDRSDRRRSLLRRRRARRGPGGHEAAEAPPPFGDEPGPLDEDGPGAFALDGDDPGELTGDEADALRASAPDWPEAPARGGRRGRRRRAGAFNGRAEAPAREPDPARATREPRHVHAVPATVEHRIEAAIDQFNASEHPRTVAGIARSLGLPDVSVHPTSPVAAIVNVVVAWELCWYRYEVDLSEEVPVVRGAGQGYELTELTELEQAVNATADDRGRLAAGTSGRGSRN
jgi:hypothetical protein